MHPSLAAFALLAIPVAPSPPAEEPGPAPSAPGAEAPPASPDGGGGAADPAALPFGPDSVRAVFAAHHGELRSCYEEVLAQGHNVQGQVLVSFVITAEGEASKARVRRTTLKNPSIEACVVQAVRRWAYPKPKRPQPVEYPIVFNEIGGATGPDAAGEGSPPPRGGRDKR